MNYYYFEILYEAKIKHTDFDILVKFIIRFSTNTILQMIYCLQNFFMYLVQVS